MFSLHGFMAFFSLQMGFGLWKGIDNLLVGGPEGEEV